MWSSSRAVGILAWLLSGVFRMSRREVGDLREMPGHNSFWGSRVCGCSRLEMDI